MNRASFSKEKTPEFTKKGEIHELFVLALSLVWFAGATPEKDEDTRGASEVRRRTSSIHLHCQAPRSSSHIGHGESQVQSNKRDSVSMLNQSHGLVGSNDNKPFAKPYEQKQVKISMECQTSPKENNVQPCFYTFGFDSPLGNYSSNIWGL